MFLFPSLSNIRESQFWCRSPVNNPFIELATFNKGIQWDKRHKQILVLAYKKDTLPLYNELVKRYQRQYPIFTAKRFSFEQFKQNWSRYLKDRVFVY